VGVLTLRALMLGAGAIIFQEALELPQHGAALAIIPVLAPLCYLLAVAPVILRKKP
jgi:hypothetical protein